MTQDEFRKNVYEVLKAVSAKTMKIGVAQRRIMRLSRRVNNQCNKQIEVSASSGNLLKHHIGDMM